MLEEKLQQTLDFYEAYSIEHGLPPSSRTMIDSRLISSTSVWKHRMKQLCHLKLLKGVKTGSITKYVVLHLTPRVLLEEILRVKKLYPEYEPVDPEVAKVVNYLPHHSEEN